MLRQENRLNQSQQPAGLRKLWTDPATHAISVLLPTRKRRESLKTSLQSLYDQAAHPENIELMLAMDTDDQETIDWVKDNVLPDLEQRGVDATLVTFTPMGYINLHQYVNALGQLANGRWLMFWNDDAVMQTKSWDLELIKHDGTFAVLRMPTHNCHPYAIFPIIPRDWYYLLGHLSNHQLTDATISQIAYTLDIMVNIPVDVLHDRHDLTGNNNDEIYQNRPMLEGNHNHPADFNHINFRQKRLDDANRIAWYLDRIGQHSEWFDRVMAGETDPWAKMTSKEQDPNGQVSIIQ